MNKTPAELYRAMLGLQERLQHANAELQCTRTEMSMLDAELRAELQRTREQVCSSSTHSSQRVVLESVFSTIPLYSNSGGELRGACPVYMLRL
jgi:hypothetical protein